MMYFRQLLHLAPVLALALTGASAPGAVAYFGPSPYAQRSDSPFAPEIADGSVHLEDFEDGALNTPFVMALYGGVTLATRPSVDEDDGVVDGIGSGISWTNRVPPLGEFGILEFTFQPDGQGRRPNFVGFVVIGPAGTILGDGSIDPRVLPNIYDSNDALLSDGRQFGMPERVNIASGSTYYSRFIGFTSEVGIARLTIDGVERVDHLQYGYVNIPEPQTMLLTLLAIILSLARRRRWNG